MGRFNWGCCYGNGHWEPLSPRSGSAGGFCSSQSFEQEDIVGSLYWGGYPDRDSLGEKKTGTVDSPVLGRQSQKALGPDGAIWGGALWLNQGLGP